MNQNPRAFLAGLQKANQGNYLGDIKTVDAFLRNLAWNAIERRGELDKDKMVRDDIDACMKAGKVFLGKDSLYKPVPMWNKPGVIDVFCSREMNINAPAAEERMASVFVSFLSDFYKLVNIALNVDGQTSPYQDQFDALIHSYVQLLIGMPQYVEN